VCAAQSDDVSGKGLPTAVASAGGVLYIASGLEVAVGAACRAVGLEPYVPTLPRGTKAWRHIYVTGEFIRCVEKDAPIYTRSDPTQALPSAQIEAELDGFCEGLGLAVAQDFHCLEPFSKYVWQLKTPDVRLVGWFLVKNWMVLHVTGDANVLHTDWDNYRPLVDATARFRASLGNAIPGPIKGVRAADVVSNKVR
jgi:hypothetical protein